MTRDARAGRSAARIRRGSPRRYSHAPPDRAGDTINATFTGGLAPNAEGCLEGTLPSTIVGGTGRFEGATGSYDFHIVACPGTFGCDSTATIDGTIQMQ